MAVQASNPRAEDVVSVGARISWGAILGGSFVALAIYFMLTVLGAAVGLTVSDRVEPTSLRTVAVAWSILTLAAALFVGGLLTSMFTVGENKVEATFYGVIMWALFLALLLMLGGMGVRAGFSGVVGLARIAEGAAGPSWETGAREARVSPELIEDLRRKAVAAADKTARSLQDQQNQKEIGASITRVAWFAFGGTWISMIAAAVGARIGAGPTFRLVLA